MGAVDAQFWGAKLKKKSGDLHPKAPSPGRIFGKDAA